MIKVLRTDFFRAFRTKAFYVFPIFVVFMCVMEMLFSASTVSSDGSVVEYVVKSIEIGPDDLLADLYDGMLMLFLGIFLVIFCTDESKDGFLKNAAGTVARRAVMPISKMIVGIVTVFIYALEFAAIKTFFYWIMSLVQKVPMEYSALPAGDAGRYITFILLCVLVHVVIVVLLVLIHEVTHNRALGIVFIFIYAAELVDRLIVGFIGLLQSELGLLKGVKVSKYLMMFNILDGYKGGNYAPLRLLIICLVWGILGGLAALVVSEKKDVR